MRWGNLERQIYLCNSCPLLIGIYRYKTVLPEAILAVLIVTSEILHCALNIYFEVFLGYMTLCDHFQVDNHDLVFHMVKTIEFLIAL